MDQSKTPVSYPPLPCKVKISLALLSAMMNVSRRSDGTVRRGLFNLFDSQVAANKTPANGVKTTDTTVDPTNNVWFRLFTPTEPGNSVSLPVIIYYHGGGFAFLTPASTFFDDFCRRLAKELPAYIVSVNYRLSPENRFPAQYEDGFSVLRWLDQHGKDSENFPQNADFSRCFIAGDSAGGNLTHHMGVRVAEPSEPVFRVLRFIGLIEMQPFYGGEKRTPSEIRLAKNPALSLELTDWFWTSFLPKGSDRDHEAANIFGPKSTDISRLDLPAILIFVGGFDLLQDRQRGYYEGLKGLGKEAYLVEYPDMLHTFYVFPELPESAMLIAEVRGFIEKQSRKKGQYK